jgi:hypothetical protein
MSNARDPENRSKKDCVCGGHSRKARKKKKDRPIPKERIRELLEEGSADFDELNEHLKRQWQPNLDVKLD